ncbi:MAG: hypothetical protein SGJ18_12230 [Pseudomonadota bacterium]|nr:hypothetical protein [Pseudomonadota bacterium]
MIPASVPTIEAKLKIILEQLYEIRVELKENQGQGFLINAEHSLTTFLRYQTDLKKTDTK